jgi:2-haloacid dehalogenase
LAPRAITFDVYSALFDTVAGLTTALAVLFRRRGPREDPAAAARLWRQKHMEYLLIANSLDREPASNRRALQATARSVLRRLDPPLTADEVDDLVGTWEALPPWPEAVEVLSALRRRPVTLSTLSNGDTGMLRTLLRRLPVTFDNTISTEGGKFKPHPSVYAKTLRLLNVPAAELLHVAGSATDAAGATAFGIRTIWVNRLGDAVADSRFAPAYDVRDLRAALGIIESLAENSGTRDQGPGT